jgi:UPF0716 protein FxsA
MLVLALLAVPILEVIAFIAVGHAIGWLPALIALLGISVIGTRLLRIRGRAAIEGVSLAVSERRAPTAAALDGALGLLGATLLAIPGFVTDALGALLMLPSGRALARRWISHRYAARVMSFVAATERFRGSARPMRSADVESTAVEDDAEQLRR